MPGEQDFDWGGLTPGAADKEHLARQVRLLLAAGKDRRAISIQLQKAGVPGGQVNAVLGEMAEAGDADACERFCGRAGLVLIGLFTAFVVLLVLVQQPWDGSRWTWRYSGWRSGYPQPVEADIPAGVGFVFFCFLYVGAMGVLWVLALGFGRLLDLLRAGSGKKR